MGLKKIAVFLSGGGSNLQSLIDHIHDDYGHLELVISNNPKAYGLERAEKNRIKSTCVDPRDHEGILEMLIHREIDFIVLAGYLKKMPSGVVQHYQNKIINIHPSLIPSFCGEGYYGLKVHEKAIEYGVKISGATVHFVDEGMDTGPIIMQEAVRVLSEDSPEDLQKRVLDVEHRMLCESVKKMCQDKLIIDGRMVKVLD